MSYAISLLTSMVMPLRLQQRQMMWNTLTQSYNYMDATKLLATYVPDHDHTWQPSTMQHHSSLEERQNYIGRVEKNSLRPTSKGKTLRKVLLQDEWKNQVEITLWPEMRHLIGDEVTPEDIIAITFTTVSEFNKMLQLESTYLTTTTINPDLPQTANHVNRLKALPAT